MMNIERITAKSTLSRVAIPALVAVSAIEMGAAWTLDTAMAAAFAYVRVLITIGVLASLVASKPNL